MVVQITNIYIYIYIFYSTKLSVTVLTQMKTILLYIYSCIGYELSYTSKFNFFKFYTLCTLQHWTQSAHIYNFLNHNTNVSLYSYGVHLKIDPFINHKNLLTQMLAHRHSTFVSVGDRQCVRNTILDLNHRGPVDCSVRVETCSPKYNVFIY